MRVGTLAGVVLALLAWSCASVAQPADISYPIRPVTLVVPYPPGGSMDVIGRLFAQHLETKLGRSFVVENRPGAGTTLAASSIAHGAPDGYTLLLATSTTLAFAPSLYEKLPYDPVTDFTPLGLTTALPVLLAVDPGLGVNSVQELVALMKAKPGALNYGSAGNGSPHHLAMELFKSTTGTEATHVPYRGVAPALTDLLGGRISLMFTDAAPALGFIREGKLKVLAVSSGTRLDALPDVPTMVEAGVAGFEVTAWHAMLAPPGLPAPIAALLSRELHGYLSASSTRDRLKEIGVQILDRPPAEQVAYTRAEIARWGEVIRRAGIKAQ